MRRSARRSRRAQGPHGDARRPTRTRWLTAASSFFLLSAPSAAEQQTSASEIPLDGKTEESLEEVARQLRNPIGPLWQLTFDTEIVGMDGGGLGGAEPAYTVSFEPQLPVALSHLGLGRFAWAAGLGIITRLTLPLVETVPLPAGPAGDARRTGFGDIQLGSVVAPYRSYGWFGSLGPTFVLPSASDDALGQGKWQAGPAAAAGYVGQDWSVYALAQQWWSFAGDRSRPDTSQLSLQYVLLRGLPERWQVGMQPSLMVDWEASGGNQISFPVGLGVGRTVRLGGVPLQFWMEVDYYAVYPNDLSGPRWGVDLQLIPVIPPLL